LKFNVVVLYTDDVFMSWAYLGALRVQTLLPKINPFLL